MCFIYGQPQGPPGWPKTINIFLCSLAETAGQRAVAVILSGLDGDGSAALKAIKAAGGLTFAQSDAAYDQQFSLWLFCCQGGVLRFS